jgi:hypothetical protein
MPVARQGNEKGKEGDDKRTFLRATLATNAG